MAAAGPEDPAILLSVSEMIDLAIGTPECGVVDFNMLQTVLHCLAQQMKILGKNVELRGSVANLPVGRDNPQTIVINEYEYEIDAAKTTDKEKPVMKITTPVTAPTPAKAEEPETILIVERLKRPDGARRSPLRQSPTRDYSPAGRATTATTAGAAPGAVATLATTGTTAQPPNLTERLSLVTISKFNILESAVEDLKNRVYGSMPKNDQILEEVRSQTNMRAITDMWTSLNVSSRLEAAEEGIAKLSSLVQDLITETDQLSSTTLPAKSGVGQAVSQVQPPVDQSSGTEVDGAPSVAIQPSKAARPSKGASLSLTKPGDINKELDQIKWDLEQLSMTFYKAMDDLAKAGSGVEVIRPPTPSTRTTMAAPGPGGGSTEPTRTTNAAPGPGGGPTEPTRTTMSAPGSGGGSTASTRATMAAPGPGGGSMMPAEVLTRINELEKKLNKCCDSIGKKEGVVQDQINSLQDQIEGLMKEMAKVGTVSSGGKLSPELIKDLEGLMELFSTVQAMQTQLKDVHETALQLAAEKEDRQHNINALLEQIELLKTVKLDREDMVEAMAEKADLRMLARKVSHDQFELACDDLSRGLEHALGKLNVQEALWQQALDDIQREIETKLDKMELSPVKDFFNNKLRQLQENLKQMASLRREAEAAGTKKKLLRDVNCISCDANAVMQTELASNLPDSRPLPAHHSMKPYLSYELDAIRKSQQTNIPQRNMHDWEAIDKQMGPKPPPKPKSEGDKHLCNRYCGGSHTTTTPAQRVARLGHFVKQWGPDVVPLSSGLAAGDDGRLYKVTTTEGANVGPGGAVDTTCTPRPPRESLEKSKPPPKQMVISAECRCLEGGK